MLNRSLPYEEYFSDLGLAVNIFVYTEEEFQKSSFNKTLTEKKSKILFDRNSFSK